LAVGVAPLARAKLEFAETELLLRPRLGEAEARGEFRFKNTGAKPVSISRVESDCLCTVPARPAEAIAPGAEGVVPVVFKVGQRRGRQVSVLRVESEGGGAQTLRLVVEVPARVVFAPRVLHFRGAEKEPKTATLTYAAEAKAELVDVVVSSPAFIVEGKPAIESGGVLRVVMRHVGEAGDDARGTVRIRSRDQGGAEHSDLVYVRHSP
jgi:hypothetical protein